MFEVLHRSLLELVTFGVGFSFVFAVAQLIRTPRGLTNYLTFLVFLGNSSIQLFVVLNVQGVLPDYPLASFLFLTSLFLLGPANYLYHHILLDPAGAVPTKIRMQFLPAMLALLAEIVFQFLPAAVQSRFLADLVQAPLQQPFTLVLFAGALFVFAYALVPLRLGLSVSGSAAIRPQLRIIFAAFGATLVAIVLISLGFVAGSWRMMLAGGAIVTIINLLVFFANNRYPNFYRLVGHEIKKVRYERSMLKGLDTDAINERLNDLMSVDAIYKDFELTLESTAQKLSITPHQLSEFMNERLNTNFRNYINAFRIEEAKKLLASAAGKNISTVCYDVGFNSKSTFNTSFRKHTDQTPSEYRRQHCRGSENGDN